MKTAVFALLFLFAISTTLPSASADALVDVDGDPVVNGGSYYLLSHTGRGLEVAQLSNDSNPVSVVQSTTASNGKPLRAYSPLRILYLTTGLAVNIQFVGNDHGVWEVLDDSVKIYKELKLVGPFKLETYTKGYFKILYTPDSSTSTPLRVSPVDGHLNTVKGPLLRVKFVKASSSSSWMSII